VLRIAPNFSIERQRRVLQYIKIPMISSVVSRACEKPAFQFSARAGQAAYVLVAFVGHGSNPKSIAAVTDLGF
jgi:hypothetical protein